MLIEITASIILTAAAQRYGAGESLVSITSDKSRCIAVCGLLEPTMLYSATLEEAVAKDLSLISDVHFVCVDRAENTLLVWVALDNPTRENRNRVFDKQFGLMDGFPEVSFDFNVISTEAQNPHEFTSDAKVVYSRS